MPELPEVEHMRRSLDAWMRGRRILRAVTTDARIVRPLAPRSFTARLAGRTVERVERRGKWLRLRLEGDGQLFVHLGMTGWFEPAEAGAAPRFERVGFELERAGKTSHLAYVDPRRWGRLWLSDVDVPPWAALGPDPLGDGIDARALARKISRRKASIKEVLLDQSVLAGVGNIQAIEALWHARIDPRSRASSLGDADVAAIVRGLRWTIRRTLADLEKNGMKAGASPFRIYGRKGEPCPRCGATLARVTLGGRTTTYCPGCQERRGA